MENLFKKYKGLQFLIPLQQMVDALLIEENLKEVKCTHFLQSQPFNPTIETMASNKIINS